MTYNASREADDQGYEMGDKGHQARANAHPWAQQEAFAESFWAGYRDGERRAGLEPLEDSDVRPEE